MGRWIHRGETLDQHAEISVLLMPEEKKTHLLEGINSIYHEISKRKV